MKGSCLCGAVEFEVDPPLRPVILCHCTQCRKTSGHIWAASSVPKAGFRLLRDDGLRWYRSSDVAERGFCSVCGAGMFWHPFGQGSMHFAPGCLNGQTGLAVNEEWYLEDAGDYYTTPRPATMLTGSCLCAANLFTIDGPMGEVTACHCSQCRKTSGHFAASFDVDEDDLIWAEKVVHEYVTPGGAARGFCPCCGSSLYFRAGDGAFSVEAGVIDNPTGGRLTGHIHVATKGDYYALTDGLPQAAGE
ncbi:MAG: GFA family protein [bacterium]